MAKTTSEITVIDYGEYEERIEKLEKRVAELENVITQFSKE